MRIQDLVATATNKDQFPDLQAYIDFSLRFLEYIGEERNRQAVVVSQNENIYRFYQFTEDAGFAVSRPFNSELLYTADDAEAAYEQFIDDMGVLERNREDALIEDPAVINRSVYTIQQSVGFALDAGIGRGLEPNTSRKINGDLFERLVLLTVRSLGVNCVSGTVNIPVLLDGKKVCGAQFQHDMIVTDEAGNLKILGSVKTTSKDRITKVFADKFLYARLTETDIPHIAIVLHDVQRANTRNRAENEYNISATFLPGHFKAYTVKLNPLDGVYYCDLRPNMKSDALLRKHINRFDVLLTHDVWKFLSREMQPPAIPPVLLGRTEAES